MVRLQSAALFLGVLLLTSSALRAQDRPTDEWLTNPVDDRTFQAYLEFFTYDAQMSFDARLVDSTEEEGVRKEHLSFQSTSGIRVTANLYNPPGGAASASGAVIVLHGGGPQGKDSARLRALCRLIARAGFTVLAIDMLHYGERATGLFPTFGEIEKHDSLYNQPAAYLEFVTQTVKDVSRAYDFLVTERGADSDRVAIMGSSRGAVLATIAAGADERLAAVALLHGGHFDFYEDGHRAAACPANYIGRIAPRPLLMINAENDADFLPEASIRPLQRMAGQPSEFRWIDGGHGFTPEEERTALIEWLRTSLR